MIELGWGDLEPGIAMIQKGLLTSPEPWLVVAMNPCRCGYYGGSLRACTCSESTVTRYQKRPSGHLLDRIDIHVEVPCVDNEKLASDHLAKAPSATRERIERAH